MIEIFCIGKPHEKIRDFAPDLAKLKQGAYNLPYHEKNNPNKPLFELLYRLGVRQIIHDGVADVVKAMDGYLYAQSRAVDSPVPKDEILFIKLN